MNINKAIFFVFLIILFQGCETNSPKEHFKITVISSNYSMAYSNETVITDSLAQARFIGGIVGEEPRILWQQALNRSQLDAFYSFLNNENLDTLNRIYNNPAIIDGMQFYFQIDYRNKSKKVQLGNLWLPQLLKLANIVNSILPDSLKYDLSEPKYVNVP
jgi:hypothetical protein